VAEAVNRIDHFYARYHSSRYVENRLVIRLNSPISESALEGLKDTFSDILTEQGELFLSAPLPEEMEEKEIAHLPRIVFDFNRKDFGRLRAFIDAINDA